MIMTTRTDSDKEERYNHGHTNDPDLNFDFYDSHGDYELDAVKLENPSLPLYQRQAELPRLPVPFIEHSLQLVLQSALPLASSTIEAESLQRAVHKFPFQAKVLQDRLEQRAKLKSLTQTSWLQQYWNEQGYLQPRCSNVIHVSYFFRFPLAHKQSSNDNNNNNSNINFLVRGAAILHRAAQYAETIRNGTQQVDVLRMHGSTSRKTKKTTPLCSSQYKYLWGACRIPGLEQDHYRVYHHCNNNHSNKPPTTPMHAVVAVRGQFFSIPLTDASGTTVVSPPQLLQSLHHILSTACGVSSEATTTTTTQLARIPQLGWLTTQPRPDWYRDYRFLRNASPAMAHALETLHSAQFMLCLDDESVENDREVALRLWHGCCDSSSSSSSSSSMNRWWDKSMQVVLCEKIEQQQQQKQTVMGYIGEHCLADGMPAVDFCQQIQSAAEYDYVNAVAVSETLTAPVTLIFAKAWASLDEANRQDIRERVQQAMTQHLASTCRYDLQILHYDKYGSRYIKECVNVSPDAFVQMAMQLAACRYFRRPAVATYESTQTRQFLHGRTETTRSASPQSVAFCQAMMSTMAASRTTDQGRNAETRARTLELLREACHTHSQYTRLATNGMGCDRHLFGLENCLQDGEIAPDLFANPLYQKSKRWLLSTSTLPGTMPGFGPVQEDGFGIGYDIAHEHVVFTCTCLRKHNDALQCCDAIGGALDDMMALVLRSDRADGPVVTSKL